MGRQLEDVGLQFDGRCRGTRLRVHDPEEEGEVEVGLACLEGKLDRVLGLGGRGEVWDDDAVCVDGGGDGGFGVEEQVQLVVGGVVATPCDGAATTRTTGDETGNEMKHVDALDRLRLDFLEDEAEVEMDVLLHA